MLQDLRFAFRTLRKRPSTTAVAVVTLALGIAVNTVVFSLVQALLLRPLEYRDADRLARLYATHEISGGDRQRVTPGAFHDWRRRSRVFETLVAARNTGLSVTGDERALNPLMREVSEGYFEVLGVAPALGRAFAPGEERVVVLDHGFWQSYYGGADVLGRTIELNYEAHEIVGVMPAGYRNPAYPQPPVLWLPMVEVAEPERRRADLVVFGRLAEGKTLADAEAEMNAVSAELTRLHPETDAGRGVRVLGLRESLVEQLRPALLALFVAVGLVLVMACANVANLLLARAVGRRQEIAVRLAMGASRARLARQLVVESVVLGLVAVAVGLLITFWAVGPLPGLAPSNLNVPLLDDVRVDLVVVAYAVVVALLASIAFGLLPMAPASRADAAALVSGSRGRDQGPGRRRLRATLVVVEVALSLLLLIGAGLTLRAFAALKALDLGFDPAGLATVRTNARGPVFGDPSRFEEFHRRVGEELATLPGVRDVGAAEILPMFAAFRPSLPAWSAEAPPPAEGGPRAILMRVTAGYFEAFGQPVLSGRGFSVDDRAGGELVAVVSPVLARAVWGGEDPVGRELVLGEREERRLRVVGVAADLRGLAQSPEPPPLLYLPHAQDPIPAMTYLLRTDADPAPLWAEAEQRIGSISRDVPVFFTTTMEQIVSDIEWQPRFVMQLLTGFALLALVLASTGLFAVLSYAVTERYREIGVRVAVGAARGDVVRMVLADAAKVTAVGLGVGVALALVATTLFQRFLDIESMSAMSYVLPAAVLAAVALVSSLVPALRATRVDPVTALRCE